MNKHTPGPWKAVHQNITEKIECFEVAEVSHMRIICDGVLWPANCGSPESDAKLIAAAPDLLEALQALMCDHGGSRAVSSDDERAIAARAAIKKATE